MSVPKAAADPRNLRNGREECYKARDRFFSCVEDLGLDSTAEVPVPSRCSTARKAYEKACRPSWVHHFDALAEKESKLLQTLHRNIGQSAQAAVGSQAGKAQPSAPGPTVK